MPDSNESKKTANSNVVLKTVASVALGAAVAFGAYLLGKTEGQEEAKHTYQERVNFAQNMTPKSSSSFTDGPDDDKIFSECNICRRSFKEVMAKDEEIHSTQCGHIFCKYCIDKAVQMRPQCPICNSNVISSQTHRIYL